MYVKRKLTNIVKETSKQSPVVLLTGPRQAGKTTFLRAIAPEKLFVTLDDLEVRSLAQKDPKTFLERFPPPVLIDEFQYAPQLLTYIKMKVDESRTKLEEAGGKYWLTGSQQFSLMKGVQESLAGRVVILNLLGFSLEEQKGDLSYDGDFLRDHARSFLTNKTQRDLWEKILRGDKPELLTHPSMDTDTYYRSYIQTYIERDVFSQLKIKDLGSFEKFMRLLSTRSGQVLNYSSFADDVGVTSATIKSWMTILRRTFQVYLLPPFFKNIGKRSLKTPKMYFLDTGLLCYFLKLSSPEDLMGSPLAGAIFETWVISELLKSYWYKGKDADFYFWRTKDGKEVDLIYPAGGKINPVEIKLTSSPDDSLFSSFEKHCFQKKFTLGCKKIICTSKMNIPRSRDTDIVSVWSIR